MDEEQHDQYHPLARQEFSISGKRFTQYNHVEGFDFAPDEMHEILWHAMVEEYNNPTQENKAKCYDIIKSMNFEYWARKRESVAKIREEAEAA